MRHGQLHRAIDRLDVEGDSAQYRRLSSSGMNWFCQLSITRRFGGTASRISPVSATRPSESVMLHGDPGFQSHSAFTPNQKRRMKSGSVNACQSFSGVVRM